MNDRPTRPGGARRREPLRAADSSSTDAHALVPRRTPRAVKAVRFAAEAANATPAIVRLTVNLAVLPSIKMVERVLESGAQVIDDIASGRDIDEIGLSLENLRDDLLAPARRLLGVSELERRVADRVSLAQSSIPTSARVVSQATTPELAPPSVDELRARGAALLKKSADPHATEELHPAFGSVLGQLAPDEARILRMMAAQGPQPAVDVYAVNPLGRPQAKTGRGLSMVGATAGCRWPDRSSTYIENLVRLGLVRVDRGEVANDDAYQVLAAQPSVAEAVSAAEKVAGKARIGRRSLHLTDFGTEFSATCLPAS